MSFYPRRWQREAADILVSLARGGSNKVLVYACPGSGKTFGGLLCALRLRERVGLGPHIVVITPSLAIKSQWVARAASLGLELLEVDNANLLLQDQLPFGAHGYIMSYQSAVNKRKTLRAFCDRHRPIVVLDEVHHTATATRDREGNVWGESVEYSCQNASFKLCTTGTPFREGNNKIAFVDYNAGGEAQAAIKYPYREAIRDGICRPIVFSLFDGENTWTGRDGKENTADFMTKLTKKRQRERLEAAISLDGNFPVRMFRDAHQQLMAIRSGDGVDAIAGGLIVAKDREHGEAIKAVMASIAGEEPVLVHNKIDDAQLQIDAFRDGTAPWIIGINMLSEGVDIPRLRVGVYATNIRAELYFHQFCGRFMRVQESARERSFVFLPADPEIAAVVDKIEDERFHALGEDGMPRRRSGSAGRTKRDVIVTESDAEIRAMAFSGMVLPVGYLEAHRDRIISFRLKSPSYHAYSDPEAAKILIDAGVLPLPGAA